MHLSIEFSLAGVIAVVLYFAAGKNNTIFNLILLVALLGFCLHPALSIPWITSASPFTVKAWRILVVTAVVLVAVSRFGIWVWPQPEIHENIGRSDEASRPEPQNHPEIDNANLPHLRMTLVIDSIGKDAVAYHIEPETMNCVISNIKASFETANILSQEVGSPFNRSLSPGDKIAITGPPFVLAPHAYNKVNVALTYDAVLGNLNGRFKSVFQFFFQTDSPRSIAPEGTKPTEQIAADSEHETARQDLVAAWKKPSGTAVLALPEKKPSGEPNLIHATNGVRDLTFNPVLGISEFSVKHGDRLVSVRAHLQPREKGIHIAIMTWDDAKGLVSLRVDGVEGK